jgi:hypothetical protein
MVPGGRERPQYGKPYLLVFMLGEIFSRTRMPISLKLGLNHSWVKEILNCSNVFKGEIITHIQKCGVGHLKIFFRTSTPVLIKLGRNHP